MQYQFQLEELYIAPLCLHNSAAISTFLIHSWIHEMNFPYTQHILLSIDMFIINNSPYYFHTLVYKEAFPQSRSLQRKRC